MIRPLINKTIKSIPFIFSQKKKNLYLLYQHNILLYIYIYIYIKEFSKFEVMKSKYFPFYLFIYLLSFSPFLIDVIVVRIRYILWQHIMLSVDTQNFLCFVNL